MLRKFLFVGIGGSGGKTIRALKLTLEQRLQQAGWQKGLPAGWQFIQIDTTYDGVDFPAPMLPLDQFAGQVAPGQSYNQMVKGLENRFHDAGSRQDALGGWCEATAPIPIETGAGMVRTIGRAVSASNLAQIRAAIGLAVGRIESQDAQMAELYTVLTGRKPGNDLPPQAVILSSIAGGTGAGMLLDVMDVVRSVNPAEKWLSQQLAFLYTPEVFDSIPEGMRAQIPMNALGAMAELMAARWSNAPSAATEALFKAGGVQIPEPEQKPGSGPVGTYLIGARNSAGVNLADSSQGSGMNEVFFAVGEALAGIVADDSIAEKFSRVFVTNVFANSGVSAVVQDKSGLTRSEDADEGMPFGGLGFARLSLGTDRLLDYSSHGLVRQQVEKLLYPEFEPKDAMKPGLDAVLIQKIVDASYEEFRHQSWLNEAHPADQVVNVLRGDDRIAASWNPSTSGQTPTGQARRQRAGEVVQRCIAHVPAGKQLSGQMWETTLLSQFNALLQEYLPEERKRVEAAAKDFVSTIQGHLLEHVADWLGRVGFAPTIQMLTRLRNDLVSVATNEMKREAEQMRARSTGFEPHLHEALTADGGQFPATANQVQRALGILQSAAERSAEAELLELTPSLLVDICKNFLEPLTVAMEDASARLRKELLGDGGASAEAMRFKAFPNIKDDAANQFVPSRYVPRQVEQLMIEANKFPEYLSSLVKSDLPDDLQTSWLSQATTLSLRGTPLRLRGEPERVDSKKKWFIVNQGWIPQDMHFRRDPSQGASKLDVSMPSTLDSLVKRTREWLSDDESAFGRLYRMPISDYCKSGTGAEQHERGQRFLAALTQILQLSQPLVGVNDQAVREFHQHTNPDLTPLGRQVEVTTIPFAKESALGKDIETMRQRMEIEEDFKFDEASTKRDVFAFSTTKSAMQPMAFTSLIQPISNAWLASSATPISRQGFWYGRRTRPLPDHIPLPSEIRLSVITGWFIASFFEQKTEETSDSNKGPWVKVWDPQFGWLNFPYPLLPLSAQDALVLPSVMQSVSLAIIAAGQNADQTPLRPYMRLKDLGREVTVTTGDRRDSNDGITPSLLVAEWVRNGALPEGAPQPSKLLATSPMNPLERAEILRSRISKNITEYSDYWTQHLARDAKDPRGWIRSPELYELRDEIDYSLQILGQYVDRLATDTSTRPSD